MVILGHKEPKEVEVQREPKVLKVVQQELKGLQVPKVFLEDHKVIEDFKVQQVLKVLDSKGLRELKDFRDPRDSKVEVFKGLKVLKDFKGLQEEVVVEELV